eukprot:COSAG02_NODE_13896_length_1333_cov_1.790113_3_plen_91_part_00
MQKPKARAASATPHRLAAARQHSAPSWCSLEAARLAGLPVVTAEIGLAEAAALRAGAWVDVAVSKQETFRFESCEALLESDGHRGDERGS